MGMFMFIDEDAMFYEGEQAEEYKARKARKAQKDYEHARADMQKAQKYNMDAYKNDRKAQVNASNTVDKYIKRFNGTTEKLRDAQVAVKSVYKRNKKNSAKNESYFESVEMI